MDLPLLENDLDSIAVIEPSLVIEGTDIPSCAVLCFFNEVIESLIASGQAKVIEQLHSAIGVHPIYEIERDGKRLAVLHPGVGAPLAAAFLEEIIALGCKTIVAVGGAGALVPELVLGHAVIVDSAIRDEGTSFHYLAPSRIVSADQKGISVLKQTLDKAGINSLVGRSWTTDAIYRETRERVARRVAEGCITVEMEAAAFMAVAKYRKVSFAQLLYAGDSLAGQNWEERGWTKLSERREQLFWLAADACLKLAD
jgi:uridine phosphorylase